MSWEGYGTCECDDAVPAAPVSPVAPVLPYAGTCRHASPCMNVYVGRACALDATKRNGYTADGLATVTFLADDEAVGVAAGSVLYALNPYTGKPSGQRR